MIYINIVFLSSTVFTQVLLKRLLNAYIDSQFPLPTHDPPGCVLSHNLVLSHLVLPPPPNFLSLEPPLTLDSDMIPFNNNKNIIIINCGFARKWYYTQNQTFSPLAQPIPDPTDMSLK